MYLGSTGVPVAASGCNEPWVEGKSAQTSHGSLQQYLVPTYDLLMARSSGQIAFVGYRFTRIDAGATPLLQHRVLVLTTLASGSVPHSKLDLRLFRCRSAKHNSMAAVHVVKPKGHRLVYKLNSAQNQGSWYSGHLAMWL